MIETTLNLQQAKDLFNQECVVIGNDNVLPIFRAVELFGRKTGEWIEECTGLNGFLAAGKDQNWWSIGSVHVEYLTYSGFLKVVSHHNSATLARLRAESEGGRIWDEIWAARCLRLDALDADEKRKREECRAKRAAARKKKQESEESA